MSDFKTIENEKTKIETKLVGKFDPNAQMLSTTYFSAIVDILKDLIPKIILMRDRIQVKHDLYEKYFEVLKNKIYELEERVAALETPEQPV